MLVVAVLVPLAVMVAAVLLERFEARAVGIDTTSAPRASRVADAPAAPAVPAAAAPPVGAERHLHAVPAVDGDRAVEGDGTAAGDDGRGTPPSVLDPDTIRFPRAS